MRSIFPWRSRNSKSVEKRSLKSTCPTLRRWVGSILISLDSTALPISQPVLLTIFARYVSQSRKSTQKTREEKEKVRPHLKLFRQRGLANKSERVKTVVFCDEHLHL